MTLSGRQCWPRFHFSSLVIVLLPLQLINAYLGKNIAHDTSPCQHTTPLVSRFLKWLDKNMQACINRVWTVCVYYFIRYNPVFAWRYCSTCQFHWRDHDTIRRLRGVSVSVYSLRQSLQPRVPWEFGIQEVDWWLMKQKTSGLWLHLPWISDSQGCSRETKIDPGKLRSLEHWIICTLIDKLTILYFQF
jgi:hypothetical protein